MALRQNNAEGGNNGVSVTAANSGGVSGTAWGLVNVGTGSSLVYDNSTSMHGAMCYALTPAASVADEVRWDDFDTPAMSVSFYMRWTSIPNDNSQFFRFFHTASGAQLTFTTASKIRLSNGSGSSVFFTSTAIPTINTWYRFEISAAPDTATTGNLKFAYYLGDSTTPIQSYSSTTVDAGSGNIRAVWFGKSTSTGLNTDVRYIDSVQANDGTTAFIGPYVGSNTNIAPSCDAGSDQATLEPYTTVMLTGTDSDSDGTIVTRTWRQVSGTAVTLNGSGTSRTYSAPGTIIGTTLVFGYTVIDDDGISSAESMVTHTVLAVTERAVIGGIEVPAITRNISTGITKLEKVWTVYGSQLVRRGTVAADNFILGETEPTTSNTGLLPGWTKAMLTTWTGSTTFTVANQTYENYLFTSVVKPKAPGLTFNNCYFAGDSSIPSGASACVVCTSDTNDSAVFNRCHFQPQTPNDFANGIIGWDFTINRCRFEDNSDSVNIFNTGSEGGAGHLNVNMYGCYVNHMTLTRPTLERTGTYPNGRPEGSHDDCIQINGGHTVNIIGNALKGYLNSNLLSAAYDGRASATGSHVIDGVTVSDSTTGDQYWLDGWYAGQEGHPIHGGSMQITQDRASVADITFNDNWCYGASTGPNIAETNKGTIQGLSIKGNRFTHDQRTASQVNIDIGTWNAMNTAGLYANNTRDDGVTVKVTVNNRT